MCIRDRPSTNRRAPSVTSSLHNHGGWKTSIPDSIPNELSLTIKQKNFYSNSTQNIPVSGTKCQVSRSDWGTGHNLIQQPPEITGTCSELSSEMWIKCTRKSPSFDSGKESRFQLCISSFSENDVVTKTSYQMLEAKFLLFSVGRGLKLLQ